MADEYKNYSLSIRINDNMAEVTYKRRERKSYNFTIVSEEEAKQAKDKQADGTGIDKTTKEV